ncbi:MAG: Ig-like domain-containing protein [Synechococcaceae cyanobacterium SM2_3_1]|nr:Ig-like domain-containing protein [Synechococcaceae cyanobacterium SM2_3_1]
MRSGFCENLWFQSLQRRRLLRTIVAFTGSFLILWAGISIAQAQITLASSDPASGTRGVSIEKVLQFRFNQPLPSDVQELQLNVTPETPLIFDLREDQLLIKPQDPWQHSTDYTVQIPAQTSLGLGEAVSLQFRTEPQFTYTRDIQPLLDASCVGCHRPEGRQRNQLLNSYSAVLQYVTPGDPGSILIDPRWTQRHASVRTVVNPNLPQQGGSPEIAYVRQLGYPVARLGQWTAEETEIVRTWIVQDQAAEDIDS